MQCSTKLDTQSLNYFVFNHKNRIKDLHVLQRVQNKQNSKTIRPTSIMRAIQILFLFYSTPRYNNIVSIQTDDILRRHSFIAPKKHIHFVQYTNRVCYEWFRLVYIYVIVPNGIWTEYIITRSLRVVYAYL